MFKVLGDKLKAIYDKSSSTLPFKADVTPDDGYIYGEDSGNEVVEYGYKVSS